VGRRFEAVQKLQKLIIEGFIKVLLLKRLLMFSKKITILPTDVTLLPVGKFSLFLSVSSLVALLIVTPALATDFAVISKTGTSGSTSLNQGSLTATPCLTDVMDSNQYVAISGSTDRTFSTTSDSRTGMTEVSGVDAYGTDPCGGGTTPQPPPPPPSLNFNQLVASAAVPFEIPSWKPGPNGEVLPDPGYTPPAGLEALLGSEPIEYDGDFEADRDALDDEIGEYAMLNAPDCQFLFFPDLNGDGVVNGSDLLMLLSKWGPCEPGSACPADFNRDGIVNVKDLHLLLHAWGAISNDGNYEIRCVSTAVELAAIQPGEPGVASYRLEHSFPINGNYVPPVLDRSFDGQGQTLGNWIAGMATNHCPEGGAGLFESIIGNANVYDLNLTAFSFTGTGDFGALAQRVEGDSNIHNVHVKDLAIRGKGNLGGLIGTVTGKVNMHNVSVGRSPFTGNSSAIRTMSNNCGNQSTNAGGLVGAVESGGEVNIHTSHAHMNKSNPVTLTAGIQASEPGDSIGGLVGAVLPNGKLTIGRSFSGAKLSSPAGYAGGLVGNVSTGLFSAISASYSASAIYAGNYSGGLVAAKHTGPYGDGLVAIMNSFAIGKNTSSPSLKKGLLGFGAEDEVIVSNSVWDMESTTVYNDGYGEGLTTSQMTDPYMFEKVLGYSSTQWNMLSGGFYPVLSSADAGFQLCLQLEANPALPGGDSLECS